MSWDIRQEAQLSLSSILSQGSQQIPSSETQSHGYKFWIEAGKGSCASGDCVTIYMCARAEEGCDGYSLLVDYSVTLLDKHGRECMSMFVERELIAGSLSNPDPFWLVVDPSSPQDPLTVTLSVRVLEMLHGKSENLQDESPYRDFALLVANQVFYVDVNYLSDLGSPLFDQWFELRKKGLKRTVLMGWDTDELCKFMDAVCTYRAPVITCRNFDFVLYQASEHRVSKVLRACERYLSQSTTIHPIRKLEIAAEHGLAMLGDSVIRGFGSGVNALISLHEYCAQNRETMDMMHPDVLEALDIHSDFVVL